MTVEDMDKGLEIGAQKVGSNAFLNYSPQERLFILNKAQREYIRRQHLSYRKSLMQSKRDFVKSEEAAENLRTILIYYTVTPANITDSSTFPNGRDLDLEELDMEYYVYSQSQPVQDGDWRANKLINATELTEYVETSYNKPLFRTYPLLLGDNKATILYDIEGGGVHQAMFVGLRKPKKLDFSTDNDTLTTESELPEGTHDDIVNLAVAILLENIKATRPHKPTQVAINDEEEG